MKHYDLLQTYLANINVFNTKLLNLHWNVVGMQFVRYHELTEEIHDILAEQIDEVAEALKMRHVYPLSTLAEYVEASTIEEVKAKDFTAEEVVAVLNADLNTMKALAAEIRNTADEAGDFEVVANFEDYTTVYSKYIWFAEAMAK